ncbi:MAG: hypothetical protein LIP03_07750 [Bacteroidales bacterium]|nr:hypothetical protein [Bacteroidales bacterium]
MKFSSYIMVAAMAAAFVACSDDDNKITNGGEEEGNTELADDYYAGGKLGTSFNSTAAAYEQPTPVVESEGMYQSFLNGETLFEKPFQTGSTGARRGLGPLYIRTSCLHCHPGYGHGRRIEGQFNTNEVGNGYLLVLTDENDSYLTSYTGMPQTHAVTPFKAPIDESQINIAWLSYTDEWGNQFPDGETYSLIYPEVTIPEAAFYVPLRGAYGDVAYENLKIKLESTIGIYGTGLLDAIDDADLLKQYQDEEAAGVNLNPAFYANGAWVKTYGSTTHPYRFTYALSRGPLQDAAGANAIWNITNVTRSDRRYHYCTTDYAVVASQDPDVQASFYDYFPERNITGDVETDIYNYLMAKDLDAEMTDQEYTDLMVWHRGLAVPAARDVDTEDFQQGKTLFTEIGCAYCHRPSWTTGADNLTDPNGFFTDGDSRLPRYPYQKIWPYTDMVQHRLEMPNDIRTGWCRTTPLWGRGLSKRCTGWDERMHDCRARTVVEAIMWHGCPNSDARVSVEKFRQLSSDDRAAIVKFIESI